MSNNMSTSEVDRLCKALDQLDESRVQSLTRIDALIDGIEAKLDLLALASNSDVNRPKMPDKPDA